MCHLGGILSTRQNRVGGCLNIKEATNDSGLKDVTSGGQQFLCMVTQWGRKVAYLLCPSKKAFASDPMRKHYIKRRFSGNKRAVVAIWDSSII